MMFIHNYNPLTAFNYSVAKTIFMICSSVLVRRKDNDHNFLHHRWA